MTIFPEFEPEAKALLSLKAPIPFQIGLHATLTGGFRPLSATPILSPDGHLPTSRETWPPLGFFRISGTRVKAEVSAQLKRFIRVFGRAPDYVDGHQHVQLMPGVRAPFLAAVSELAPNAWVRQCAPARWSDELFNAKSRFLGFLSSGFRRKARRAGLAFNPAFSGAYDYDRPGDFSASFARFVKGMPEGGVIMCHPGHSDEVLRSRDILTDQRETEFAFFMSGEMSRILAETGAALA
jgi:predicted glycoside hydrolase/deacetylase ChbG (UPF0249 family)